MLATALRRRGCDERTARLAVDAGMAVLRLATRRWIFEPDAGFPALLAAGAADLPAVATEGATTASAGERAAAKKS